MWVRALAVTTQFNQEGLGLPDGEVTISTVTPLSSGSESGTSCFATRAATQ